MLRASLYIIGCSARNRTRKRIARLRQPRYLAGLLAALAYFYFAIFGQFRAGRTRARQRGLPDPALGAGARIAAVAPSVVSLMLVALGAIAWVLPFDSGLLDFSNAEVQLLVPAPVSRRALLVYRMLRAQIGMLFGAAVTGLVFAAAGGYSRLRTALAMWTLLAAMKLYFTGVTLARAKLAAGATTAGWAAWAPVVWIGGTTAFVAGALARVIRAAPVAGLADAVARIRTVATEGPSRVLVWPFAALSRPLFTTEPAAFTSALLVSLGIAAALAVWVLESDRALPDVLAELATRRAGARGSGADYRTGHLEWRLDPAGRPETAFAWKAALQMFRTVDRRSLVRLASLAAILVLAAAAVGRTNGLAAAVLSLAVMGAIFTVAMAPQILRVDLRQDLGRLDMLKTWPIPSGAVIRGELLWPGLFLSLAAWALMGLAWLLSAGMASSTTLGAPTLEWRLSTGLALAILAPALIFAQLLIHNAVAVIFPGWISLGRLRARGLDAMGQRLIMLAGTWLALAVLVVPGAIAGGVLWFVARGVIGGFALVPGAAVCAAVMGVEVVLGSEALGPVYQRMDVLAVERADD